MSAWQMTHNPASMLDAHSWFSNTNLQTQAFHSLPCLGAMTFRHLDVVLRKILLLENNSEYLMYFSIISKHATFRVYLQYSFQGSGMIKTNEQADEGVPKGPRGPKIPQCS